MMVMKAWSNNNHDNNGTRRSHRRNERDFQREKEHTGTLTDIFCFVNLEREKHNFFFWETFKKYPFYMSWVRERKTSNVVVVVLLLLVSLMTDLVFFTKLEFWKLVFKKIPILLLSLGTLKQVPFIKSVFLCVFHNIILSC